MGGGERDASEMQASISIVARRVPAEFSSSRDNGNRANLWSGMSMQGLDEND